MVFSPCQALRATNTKNELPSKIVNLQLRKVQFLKLCNQLFDISEQNLYDFVPPLTKIAMSTKKIMHVPDPH